MNALIRLCFLLLMFGLLAQPVYALGDQINVLIYGAIGLVLAGFVLLVVVAGKILRAFFPRKPPSTALPPADAPPASAQPVTTPLRFLLILVAIMIFVLTLINSLAR